MAELDRFSEQSKRTGALIIYRWIDVSVYRKSTGKRTCEEVAAGFLWDLHVSGVLSPAISGEESRWLLPGSLVRGLV